MLRYAFRQLKMSANQQPSSSNPNGPLQGQPNSPLQGYPDSLDSFDVALAADPDFFFRVGDYEYDSFDEELEEDPDRYFVHIDTDEEEEVQYGGAVVDHIQIGQEYQQHVRRFNLYHW